MFRVFKRSAKVIKSDGTQMTQKELMVTDAVNESIHPIIVDPLFQRHLRSILSAFLV